MLLREAEAESCGWVLGAWFMVRLDGQGQGAWGMGQYSCMGMGKGMGTGEMGGYGHTDMDVGLGHVQLYNMQHVARAGASSGRQTEPEMLRSYHQHARCAVACNETSVVCNGTLHSSL